MKVEEILESRPNDFQGFTRTTFLSGGKAIYIFTKAGNEPKVGDELDGTVTQDKAGKNKFTKAKPEQGSFGYAGPKRTSPVDKDAQRESIEKQSSLKAAIEIVRDAALINEDLETYTRRVTRTADYLYRNLPSIGTQEQVKTGGELDA